MICNLLNMYLILDLRVTYLNHLRGQVVESAAHGGAPAAGRVHGPPEVGDLEVALHVEEEVLGLDVAVDHLHRMAVRQGLDNHNIKSWTHIIKLYQHT